MRTDPAYRSNAKRVWRLIRKAAVQPQDCQDLPRFIPRSEYARAARLWLEGYRREAIPSSTEQTQPLTLRTVADMTDRDWRVVRAGVRMQQQGGGFVREAATAATQLVATERVRPVVQPAHEKTPPQFAVRRLAGA